MGVVYEGWDTSIERRVAIKAIRSHLLQSEEAGAADPNATRPSSDSEATRTRQEAETLRSRFKREAQAAGRLSHPRIVTVYEYGEEEQAGPSGEVLKVPYIVMEFVEGTELRRLLKPDSGRFELPGILQIMDQLLEALSYSHSHGVVHRDIKPENIMVLTDGSIKVADFGIARVEASTLTATGAVFGTPYYMAPEQLLGEKADQRADLYAAGGVLYELLTGDRPFSGSMATVMAKVLKEQPTPPSQISVTLSPAFDALVARALAKRPDERFQTAEEFREALRAVNGRGGSSTTDAAPRRSWLLPLGIAAGVGVLAVGGFLYFFKGGSAASSVPLPAVVSDPGARVDTGSAAASRSGAALVAPLQSPTLAPGMARITAVGLAQGEGASAVMAARLKEDAGQRLMAKAAALFVEPAALKAHYGLLRTKVFSHSEGIVTSVLTEPTPQQAPNGRMFASMRADLNVRALRTRLNEVSSQEHLELARNPAHARVSVRIQTQDADVGASSAQPSEVAENILKERLISYHFAVVDDPTQADFLVEGTASLRRLSLRLAASGLTIEKFTLTSWTLKASEARSHEQFYFNTRVPEKQSWATRELALQAIGQQVGEELSEGLFLKNFDYPPRSTLVRIQGLPEASVPALLLELHMSWLVLDAVADGGQEDSPVIRVDLAGGAREMSELIQQGVVGPLNQQLQHTCFSVLETNEALTSLQFDPACTGILQKQENTDSWGVEGGDRQVRSSRRAHVGTLR